MSGSLFLERWRGSRAVRLIPEPEEILEARSRQEALRCLEQIESGRGSMPAGGPRWAGWFGFVSYDWGLSNVLAEESPRTRILPLLRFYRATRVRTIRPDTNVRSRMPACRLLNRSDSRRGYVRKILGIQEELRKGNAYEVNLSQRWAWEFDRPPNAALLFSRIGRALRPRYGFFEQNGDAAILGFSPELFFSTNRRTLTAEPIKGTARAGAKGLLQSAKDRSELLMITDLFRNDFGKICEAGSIHAGRPKELRLPYARHLFSHIRGRLKPGSGLPEIFAALFPSGSVTGAPKLAACRIINRLEPFAREEAFGAAGWIGRDRMEFSVLIRTAQIQHKTLRYTAGGGITVYSDPEKEYEESILKAARFMQCLPCRKSEKMNE